MERSSSFALSQPVSRLSTPAPLSSGTSSVYGVMSGELSPKRARQAANGAGSGVGSKEPGPVYELCPDGGVVRLRCPVCGADRFRSLLGFANHCRINCGLEVNNPEDRLQKCGVPVPADELPMALAQATGRGTSALRRDRELAAIRAGVQAPIVDATRQPGIREFGESGQYSEMTLSYPISASDKPVLGSLASSQADVEALRSRFHIRKRIVVGNWARSLEAPGQVLDEAEAAAQQLATHEWRLFVRPFDPHDDMSLYIRSVRFHLHESYAPNDVISVDKRPFELRMTGWGEFPARVEIIFQDSSRNRPVEIVHFLRLRPCPPRGSAQLMSEQAYDLEIDRRSGQPASTAPDTVVAQPTGHPIEDALAMASRLFPLWGTLPKQAPPGAAAYNRAVSYAEYAKLSLFDQQTLERERALALQRHLLPQHPELGLDFVLDWCRRSGLTPLPLPGPEQTDSGSASAAQDALGSLSTAELASLHYCRYCGLAHFPQDRFEVLQKNCAMRPRKLHLSSRSTASDLVSTFSLAAEASASLQDGNRQKHMIEGSEAVPTEAVDDQDWSEETRWALQNISPLELPAWSRPSKDSCGLLATAARRFLGDLMQKATGKLPDTIERAVGRPALLTPLHVYLAITGLTPVAANAPIVPKDKQPSEEQASAPSTPRVPNRFDFLSNAFMAGT